MGHYYGEISVRGWVAKVVETYFRRSVPIKRIEIVSSALRELEGGFGYFAHATAECKIAVFDFFDREPACLECIISSYGFSATPVTSHRDEDEVLQQSARTVAMKRINCGEDFARLTLHTGFFAQFTHRCLLDRLIRLNLSSRKSPEPGVGWVRPSH